MSDETPIVVDDDDEDDDEPITCPACHGSGKGKPHQFLWWRWQFCCLRCVGYCYLWPSQLTAAERKELGIWQ